jgi:hypothetical protein
MEDFAGFNDPEKRKAPTHNASGSLQITESSVGSGSNIQPTIRPTEYRCYIKEVVLYATAGAVTASWKTPSSSGQTPRPGGT